MKPALVTVLLVLAGLGAGYAYMPDVRNGMNQFAVEFADGFERGYSAATGRSFSMGRSSSDGSPEPASGDSQRQLDSSSFSDHSGRDLLESAGAEPDLRGYGRVPDLRKALEHDENGRLREHLDAFRDELDVQARRARMKGLLFEWAGAADVDPEGRGPNIDGRKLSTLEAFLERDFRQQGSPNPRPGGAAELHKAFDILKTEMYSQLMRQTHLAPYFDAIAFRVNASGLGFDFSDTTSNLQETFVRDSARGLTDLFEFERAGGERLRAMGFDPYRLMRDWLLEAGNDPALQSALMALGWDAVRMDGQGTAAREIVVAHEGGATLKAGPGGDWLLGGYGDDTLHPGPGDDLLYGGAGNNTYRFGVGSGHNTLIEMYGDRGRSVIEVAPGIRAEDLDIQVEGHELVLAHRNGEDSIRIQNWFGSIHPKRHSLHAVRLADGEIIDLPDASFRVRP
ncbi:MULTISPECIES: calcium-binding protein [unclassified Thioalkalivibrio]|uniref:calcium-binding protein n=1 Tax=unclassified Thioalkalivibrio TaxID=2621013 RepID=UPI0003652C24|nr:MULTISPECIES: calcium-binding protein [unclassified Thioalkalivibrio]